MIAGVVVFGFSAVIYTKESKVFCQETSDLIQQQNGEYAKTIFLYW